MREYQNALKSLSLSSLPVNDERKGDNNHGNNDTNNKKNKDSNDKSNIKNDNNKNKNDNSKIKSKSISSGYIFNHMKKINNTNHMSNSNYTNSKFDFKLLLDIINHDFDISNDEYSILEYDLFQVFYLRSIWCISVAAKNVEKNIFLNMKEKGKKG